jgi:hypothetical protein
LERDWTGTTVGTSEFPWKLFLQLLFLNPDDGELGWNFVQINARIGSSGFSISDHGGLQWDVAKGFGGWLGESSFDIVLFRLAFAALSQPK